MPLELSQLSHSHTCHITPVPLQPLAPIRTSYDHLLAPITTCLIFCPCTYCDLQSMHKVRILVHIDRALHELICRSPVSEPAGWVNTKEPHLDPNGFKCRITCQTGQYCGSPVCTGPTGCRLEFVTQHGAGHTFLPSSRLCPSTGKHCCHEIPWHQSYHRIERGDGSRMIQLAFVLI